MKLPIGIIDRYLMRTVLGGSLLVLLILLALITFFSFLGEIEDVGRGDYTLWKAAFYVLLRAPGSAYEMFPVCILLGALIGLGNLAAGSELVVLRSAGMSVKRMAVPVIMAGVLLAISCYALGDFLAPAAGQHAQTMRSAAKSGAGSQLADSLWFKDGNAIVHVREVNAEDNIGKVEIFRLAGANKLSSATQASHAEYKNDQWYLRNWESTQFTDAGSNTDFALQRNWQTQLNPELISLFIIEAETFSAFGLSRYIDYLRDNALDSTNYQQAFWNKIVTPVSVVLMAFLALPFVLGSLRNSGAAVRLLIGVLVGVGYFLLNQIMGNTSQVYGVPPVVAAWAPSLLILLLGGWLVSRAR